MSSCLSPFGADCTLKRFSVHLYDTRPTLLIYKLQINFLLTQINLFFPSTERLRILIQKRNSGNRMQNNFAEVQFLFQRP